MNILVTGATGFIGRNFILELLKEEKYSKIYVPVRSIEKLRAQFLGDGFEKIPEKIIPIVSSAREWNLKEIESVEEVVHCAGTLFATTYQEFYQTNVVGTLNLLKNFSKLRRVVILSSQAAAGPCKEGQAARTEEDPETPLTLYGRSKLEMEKEVKEQFPQFPIVFLRPPMVLGARDHASLPLFKMVKSVVRPKPGFKPKIYSFISVKDVISAILSVLNKEDLNGAQAQSFFISSEKLITDLDLIETAAKTMKRFGVSLPFPQSILKVVALVTEKIPVIAEKIPTLNPDRIKEVFPNRWVVSSEKFQKSFHWNSLQSLASTLQETKDWYVSSGLLKP